MATHAFRQFGKDDDESDVFDGVSSDQSYRNNTERFGHKIESILSTLARMRPPYRQELPKHSKVAKHLWNSMLN